MKKRLLGRQGLEVSAIGPGARYPEAGMLAVNG
jgi:hypothetical protein